MRSRRTDRHARPQEPGCADRVDRRVAESIDQARETVAGGGLANVEFMQADILELPFQPGSFDHVFVCFVLEHLAEPVEALVAFERLLRPGGTITVIEGDHGSAYFHPDSPEARRAILCLVALQRMAGGNALIGRQLYPLMVSAGFDGVQVSPRMVYVDGSRPDLVEGFTKRTFTAMVEGVRESATESGMVEPEVFDEGIRALYRTAADDGVFSYTFFKGLGRKATAARSSR